MIDLHDERLLTLQEAAELLPGSTAISTLHRWRQRGVRGVQLETCLIGGKRYTSKEALQRFADAITAAVDEESTQVVFESQNEVARRLDEIGL